MNQKRFLGGDGLCVPSENEGDEQHTKSLPSLRGCADCCVERPLLSALKEMDDRRLDGVLSPIFCLKSMDLLKPFTPQGR
ncbi:hypothetical protein BO78DRAFT_217787 [Aspergillus sclerotiicarbonarius CBS 121057]|uniref:Uncharacterized protein n=1 Tax=Aspergillus sclerotiicarbonarius (strain CBS 121057 / IBT 28362) TaxID=1448318 RepID=A0A319E2Z0_ASPSB|nr:hypothetical protein BO78DRAFT_217787 [Aspergillus sclerotiicarbonarius CBS 121057]